MQVCHRIYTGGKKQVQILSLIITISAVRMIIILYIIVIVFLKRNLTWQDSMLFAPGQVLKTFE